MNRIKDLATISARAVTKTVLPDWVYTSTFGKARVANPPSAVRKKHAIDIELINRTRVVWLDKHRSAQGVIVYIHAGGYVSGPFYGEWEWASAQADARQCAALIIDYRYAPDYPHPAALDDCRAVLGELSSKGVLTDGSYVIAGHRSGAGLAFSIVANRLSEAAKQFDQVSMPAAIVAMNPWLDLELGNLELSQTAGEKDPVHERQMLKLAIKCYAGRASLEDPELNPVYADLSVLPPVHYSVGVKDIFLTDARVQKLHLEQDKVQLKYREVPGNINITPRLRRGEDMQRLLREQSVFIERALG